MPKVTITIQDLPGGGVKVVSDPTFEQLATTAAARQSQLEPSMVYAMRALLGIRQMNQAANKSQRENSRIIIPKLRGMS